MGLKEDEIILCRLLTSALTGNSENTINRINIEPVLKIAKAHNILSLLYDTLVACDILSEYQKEYLERESRKIVQQNYRLLFLTKYIQNKCEEAGMKTAVLKGSAASVYFPVPELRKSGDIDILIEDKSKLDIVEKIFFQDGITKEKEQWRNHHVRYYSPEGIELELHVMLAETLDYAKLNRYLDGKTKEFLNHTIKKEIMGVTMNVLTEGYHAFYLLVHMVQHFMGAGFGLKLLCDWVVFWNGAISDTDQDDFFRLTKESGLLSFAQIITDVCITYLGLKAQQVSFFMEGVTFADHYQEEFMQEIFEAGEFGKSGKDRMLLMRGTNITDYMREFHHQTKITYPNASRYFVCFPFLWIKMLCGFSYRNYKKRKVSGFAILKKAGERSKMIKKLGLFQEK